MTTLQHLFLIAALGYILGFVEIRGLKLGTSAILPIALVFGHYGVAMPPIVRDFGLACFVGSVGLLAGPIFFRSFKKQAAAYIVTGATIVICGALVTALAIILFDIPVALALGIFSGALTSTPGLAAAIEATGSSLASIGYGIAYPFGVVGVVLFVQLIPKLVGADITSEVEKMIALQEKDRLEIESMQEMPVRSIEPSGLSIVALSLVLGLALSQLRVPLPSGGVFSLGIAGGPLFSGLIFGHFGSFFGISLNPPAKTLETLRELGLVLFLIAAGTAAGSGFLSVILEYGISLLLIGAVITIIPMCIGYYIARELFKVTLPDSLGVVCGGMTSTPALGSLIALCQTDRVAASYAAAYPIALILMVIGSQVLALM